MDQDDTSTRNQARIIHGTHGWWAVDYSLPGDDSIVMPWLIHYDTPEMSGHGVYNFAYCPTREDATQLVELLSEMDQKPAGYLKMTGKKS